MSFCDKCGAYIPIGDTVCPACGYDPEAEAKKAAEAAARAAEEERRRAAEQARIEREEAARKAREEAERKAREEEERRAAELRERWQQDPRQYQTFTGGAAQGQYTSQRTAPGAQQTQYASQRTGQANAGEYRQPNAGEYRDETMRRKASESVSRQKLSVLSYLGLLWLVPILSQKDDAFTRYHSNQGLLLIIFSAAMWLLGKAYGIFGTIGWIGTIIGMIRGIKNVSAGKMEPLASFTDGINIIK